MNPFVQVDKDEWETFLSEFSKLAKNYELILGKLDLALARIEVQRSENKRLEPDKIKQDQSTINANEAERTVKSKPGFLGFFSRIGLFRLAPRSQTLTYASCRRCSYAIRRASRFCVGCGADFGAVVCPCGRSVSTNDRFCDQCGRII